MRTDFVRQLLSFAILPMSSREAKEEKREVKGVLEVVKKLPVEASKYKEGMGDEREHIGTYAEDFTRETGLGHGKRPNLIDAVGVTMDVIKDLAEEVDEIAGGKERRRSIARSPVRTNPSVASSAFRNVALNMTLCAMIGASPINPTRDGAISEKRLWPARNSVDSP